MPKVEWNGDRLIAAAKQAAKEIAQQTAEIVKGKAVDLCPLDSAQTRNSATVTEQEKGAEISFNTPQAAWLHESQNYTPSHAGTGPNYLRQPLLDEQPAYNEAIAAAMRAIFG
jgi:hypothetical protein